MEGFRFCQWTKIKIDELNGTDYSKDFYKFYTIDWQSPKFVTYIIGDYKNV